MTDLEEQTWLARRALHLMKEAPEQPAASLSDQERDFQLRVAQSAIANARRAKTVLARFGGLMPLDGVLQEIAAWGPCTEGEGRA